jgi:hypothetical protein|uniref:Uncharacterized protein n=1 Tax=viral metagenome TaxID=1070528 RepID=A0A6C0HCB7_9ZZZZ
MDDIIDISTINLNENLSEDWNARPSSSSKSTNFGGGLELLMNDKKKEGSGRQSSDIELDDLNNLEDELNNLTDDVDNARFESRSDLFNRGNSFENKHSVRFDDNGASLGQATAESDGESKTWDGYTKFNNVPINPDKALPSQPQMSKEELLREKFKYLRKLETLESKGVTLTKKYSMESPLAEMQGEYEMIMEEKAKQNSIKFQGNMLMACINGIEFLNNRFDPFDIKLDGWSDQVNENLNDYDDVFAELYDKYKSRASMAPELKLLFQLGGSAMMVHMTNTMFKSAMPGMDDILRQNPDLMRQFQTAAVNSMSQQSPGFSGFMNNMMNPEPQVGFSGPPPPPISTQNRDAPTSRPGNNTSSSSRFSNARPVFGNENDGINIRENFGGTSDVPRSSRAEMKGPSDISDILNGLKTKTINIQEVPPSSQSTINGGNDSSTISISELKELQSEGNMPKRSKRRQKSDKNTVSLDI